ncbi:MAG: hypothetical protein LBD51_01065, partial [Bifidobacteriaceae bacterium]|nr:hypothetical protein [Bifidobacteriaceae bacterium]
MDRARLTPRLAHFGLGSFHRAHQAVYTEIGNHASDGDWGIVAVAPGSTATVAAMRAQDCFYSVTRQTARGASTRVVASIVGALHARADSAQVQRLLENPALAAVTLTITEKGYCRRPGVPTTSPLAASFPPASAPRGEALAGEALAVDPQIGNALAGQAGAGDTLAGDTLAGDRLAGEAPAPGGLALDTGDPGIAADLALAARGGQAPATAIGHLAFGLARRFRAHRIPLTLVSADNMTGNGPALRQVLLDFIAASAWPDSAAIAAWVANEVCFPETIVDRIVPAPTDAARDAAQAALGLRDQMAVACEPYRQWVIQDLFATARPPWEAA